MEKCIHYFAFGVRGLVTALGLCDVDLRHSRQQGGPAFDVAEVEKALLDVGFVAVPEGSSVGIPFVCTDDYGRTGLMFSPEGPDRSIQALIATAFWSLLLQDPDELADFSAKVYHPGTGNWMHLGCEHGEPYCEETTSSGDESGDFDE